MLTLKQLARHKHFGIFNPNNWTKSAKDRISLNTILISSPAVGFNYTRDGVTLITTISIFYTEVVNLEDISLVSTNHNNGNVYQLLNVPWLNVQSNGGVAGSRSRITRGDSPRISRKGQNTLAQIALPRNRNLLSVLEANPVRTHWS